MNKNKKVSVYFNIDKSLADEMDNFIKLSKDDPYVNLKSRPNLAIQAIIEYLKKRKNKM